MQSDNLARMGNIAVMDHTSTKWSVRLEQGRSRNRVLRNKVRHSMEQSLKPRQGNRAQDRDQERLRFPRTNLRHAILLHIHSFLYSDIGQRMVQQTTLVTLSR
jgi:fido (protein-threonine AMPylation protein)